MRNPEIFGIEIREGDKEFHESQGTNSHQSLCEFYIIESLNHLVWKRSLKISNQSIAITSYIVLSLL